MFATLKQYLRHTSWPIVAAMIALMTFGVLAIRVSEQADPRLAGQAVRQAGYAGAALVAFVLMVLIPYPRVGRWAYPLFVVTLVLLVGVFFTRPIKGASRWFDLKLVKVQPSEVAKLTYIIMLAWYLRFGDHYRRLRGLIVPFALALLPMAELKPEM